LAVLEGFHLGQRPDAIARIFIDISCDFDAPTAVVRFGFVDADAH